MSIENPHISNIRNIRTNFNHLLEVGVKLLTEDMRKFPSFDPSAPYEEKNYYFNRANTLGLLLIGVGMNHFAEIYFNEMLKLIEEFEKRNNKKFNKGMVYGNLGIAKIAQGEFDRGIAYLMAGFKEDAPITGDHEKHFLDSPLYLQFEKRVHEYMKIKRQIYTAAPPDDTYGHDFMKCLNTDNRLYLMAVLNNLRINKDIFVSGNENKYTKGRILSTLSDFCVFIEDAIKRKLGLSTRIELFNLLRQHVLCSEVWRTDVERYWNYATSANMGNLETNLHNIFYISNDNVKRFLTLGAIRNFSGHNFDIDGPFFFAHLDEVENNIFGAMFYLRDNAKL